MPLSVGRWSGRRRPARAGRPTGTSPRPTPRRRSVDRRGDQRGWCWGRDEIGASRDCDEGKTKASDPELHGEIVAGPRIWRAPHAQQDYPAANRSSGLSSGSVQGGYRHRQTLAGMRASMSTPWSAVLCPDRPGANATRSGRADRRSWGCGRLRAARRRRGHAPRAVRRRGPWPGRIRAPRVRAAIRALGSTRRSHSNRSAAGPGRTPGTRGRSGSTG